MANEARTQYLAGRTVYFTWEDASAELWNNATDDFEARVAANWTSLKYCHAATEKTVVGAAYSEYVATLPAEIVTAGRYRWTAYDQAGGSPAVGDDWVSSGHVDWNGTAEIVLSSVATQVSVDDIPTNTELTTAIAAGDDAVLAAVGALDIPTAAEVATAAAAAILVTPANKIATNGSNQVTTSNPSGGAQTVIINSDEVEIT
jgi:hypothetical protein